LKKCRCEINRAIDTLSQYKTHALECQVKDAYIYIRLLLYII